MENAKIERAIGGKAEEKEREEGREREGGREGGEGGIVAWRYRSMQLGLILDLGDGE